ncbi:glycoside hydrolase family 113 [Maribacter sp. ACAM166]|uniref:glycoside hydrolase family 113 n=1 Tax=Maribacter sp. ACAM166 TaxID=2508996 RepID=UPI0010FE8A5A|nr:hypothetical protein [Maribacter sp. ACAM166]TLP82805.1 hypothetical protein ES765_01175 [Maribacter sp. ACAM166]
MKNNYLVVTLVIALLVVGITGVQFLSGAENEVVLNKLDSIPTKRDLRRSFFEKREILVVYGAKDAELSQKYKEILERVSLEVPTNSWRSAKIIYKSVSEVTEENLNEYVVFFVGAIDDNVILKRYISQTPFQINKKYIKIGSKKTRNENFILSVGFYPSPLKPKMPFSFLTGTNSEEVFNFFVEKIKDHGQSFYRQNLDYELYKNHERVIMGDFDAKWKTDVTTFFDFSSGADVLLETERYRLINHESAIESSQVTELTDRIERTASEILAFVEGTTTVPRITYHFYKNMEEKGLITGSTDQSHMDTLDNSVHTIINKIYQNNNIGKDNALLLHHLLGASKKDILTYGLSIYFTDAWQVRGFQYWSARLVESGNTLSIAELLDNAYLEMESPLIRDCMAGLFVDFLVNSWGKKYFLDKYEDVELTSQELHELEGAWQLFLEALPIAYPKNKVEAKKLPYLKGFNFAHEGYSIYNGYGSSKATESLLKQKNLGSNAMAIVPYSGIEDVHTPAPFRFSTHAGGENDEAVVHAASTAHDMGMFTLLKPQIFVGGSWPGGIEMPTNEQWDVFFDHYYRWIRHYAFLGEIHEMDALCLGVEFTKATLSRPDAWRSMIKRTRGLFSGQLTYAANWGQEFENIEFWDELDFIGLNSYYPLSKKDNPTDEELTLKFDTIKAKIRTVYKRFKKPIVFTEIGFRSIDAPWKNPHAEADESINEEAQERCYEIIFKGIENEPWCQGILWWKYPSYLEYRGSDNNAFTPNNKLADETVRKWFSK